MPTRLEFDIEWRITLFTLLLLPVLVSLGFWQLQRADEKAALARDFALKQASPPAPLANLGNRSAEALAYLPVSLAGRYREEYFLLDNRMQERKYGNEVLALFELDSGELALVNRGWVAADPSRLRMPEVPPVPVGRARLKGHVYVSPGAPYLLADEPLAPGWPKRIQAVEMDKIRAGLGGTVFPYPVRIDAAQPGALSVDWQVINVSPEKHTGYAVQWFTMAAVLALIYLLRSTNIWQLLRGRRRAGDDHE